MTQAILQSDFLTMLNIEQTFSDVRAECDHLPLVRRFDYVKYKRSQRPDLHAFLLLDELVPGTKNIVSTATDDEIYLSVLPCDLAKVAKREHIRELVLCGVRYDAQFESLCLFV